MLFSLAPSQAARALSRARAMTARSGAGFTRQRLGIGGLTLVLATAAAGGAGFAGTPVEAHPVNVAAPTAQFHTSAFGAAALRPDFGKSDLFADEAGSDVVILWDPACGCYRIVPINCDCSGPVAYNQDGDTFVDALAPVANALLVEQFNVASGGLQSSFAVPLGTLNIAVDTLSGNVLAQGASQLELFSSAGQPLGAMKLSEPVTGVAYDASSKTYSIVIGDQEIIITDSLLRPRFKWPLPSPGPDPYRVASDGRGSLYLHGDGSTQVIQMHGLGKPAPTIRTLKLADPNGPIGIASDGQTIYVDDNGTIAGYSFSGKPVKNVLNGTPTTGSFHYTP